jgi:hypothetical protein
MQASIKLALGMVIAASLGTAALAQEGGPVATATVADPIGPVPDPTHIPFVLPKDIVWHGQVGRQQSANLYGDPTKPGPYGTLFRYYPGYFSGPHYHAGDRWVYVLSGTWWVSSSTIFDEKTTYPIPAGSFATDIKGTIHFDGARAGEKEPAVVLLTGIGPALTQPVDEKGQPKGHPH